jgi:uncharacterized protein (DUF362 family)
MNRRNFITTMAALLGSRWLLLGNGLPAQADEPIPAGTPGSMLADPPELEPANPTVQAATGLPDLVLARGDAAQATRRAIDALGGMGRFVKPGMVVALKPNASFPRPARMGATTHPGVLTAVIAACYEAGARRVFVVDHTMSNPKRCFDRNGTAEAVAAFPKAKLVSLDREKAYREVQVPGGKVLGSTMIPSLLDKADLLINIPTAKSHSATGVSLGLKNLMGLIWNRNEFHSAFDLHQGVADLGLVIKPQLTILDAMVILKTGGPTGPGEIDEFGGVVAGTDPVAVDAYGVGLSTWNGQTLTPDRVAYLRHAVDHGLGTMDLGKLQIRELT